MPKIILAGDFPKIGEMAQLLSQLGFAGKELLKTFMVLAKIGKLNKEEICCGEKA